jgi:hypothetical protein
MLIKSNLLRWVIFASLAAVIVLPIYNIFFLTPAYTDFITKNQEASLIQVASQMAAELIAVESNITRDSLAGNFPDELEHIRKMFGLWKIKVYAPSGEMLYSSPPEGAGYVKKGGDFFRDIVVGRKARALVMKKAAEAHQEKYGEITLLETYVPITRGDKVVGVFEIYSDITDSKLLLDRLRWRSNGSMFAIAVILLLAVIVSVYKANRNINERMKMEAEREKLIQELQKALAEVKKLSGFLPICASCKKIRDDKGYWNQIEEYIRTHSEAEFSHGLCPDCTRKLYPDFRKKKK